MGLALWLALAGVAGVALWRERVQTIEFAKRSASSTVALLEQHTASTFHAVSLALDDVTARMANHSYVKDDPSLREAMRSYLRDMPYVRAIYVIDENGTIIQDTDYPTTPKKSLADRPYFKVHQEDPALIGTIGAPLQSRSGSGWFVPVTRRIGSGGTFRGIVVAAIQLRYFTELYLRMGLGDGQSIVMFHRDGTLIAQYPTDDLNVGKTYSEYPLFQQHLPVQRRDVYESSGPPVSYDRIFSYAALESQPLIVGLAHDKHAVLSGWRRALEVALLSLAMAAFLIALAVSEYIMREAHRARVRDRLLQGEKLEALGRLTGGIAHDFGNVLGIVSNNLELIARQAPYVNDRSTLRAIEGAKRAVSIGSTLTRELMAFARKRELNVVTMDVADALTRAEPLLRQAAGSKVQLQVSAQPGAFCQIDYTQLEVALINLVANARDAMKERGKIEVRAGPAEPRLVRISVADDGPGMAEDVKRRAMEPFFTTKGENGTGLGLSQVYGFVKQLGGDVVIETAPGAGTSVNLSFPSAAA